VPSERVGKSFLTQLVRFAGHFKVLSDIQGWISMTLQASTKVLALERISLACTSWHREVVDS